MTRNQGLRTAGTSSNPAAPPYTDKAYNWDSRVRTIPGVKSAQRYALEEYFYQLPQLNASIGVATNLNFEILGTNASNDDVTFSATYAGIDMETDGASGDQVIVLPHLDTSQTAWSGIKWGTENSTSWECILTTGASVASTVIWAGLKLTNTSVVATDNDGAYFRYDGTPANWTAVTNIGGTDVEFDCGATFGAVAAITRYHLRIDIDSSRIASFFINDNLVYKSTALTNDVDLIPYVGVQAAAVAAKKIILHYEGISRIFFE